jgi:predicted nucleic acid-binding Zn ribbon protein
MKLSMSGVMSKCKSCYTEKDVIYAFTDEDGKDGFTYSCTKCVDKVRTILKNKGISL